MARKRRRRRTRRRRTQRRDPLTGMTIGATKSLVGLTVATTLIKHVKKAK